MIFVCFVHGKVYLSCILLHVFGGVLPCKYAHGSDARSIFPPANAHFLANLNPPRSSKNPRTLGQKTHGRWAATYTVHAHPLRPPHTGIVRTTEDKTLPTPNYHKDYHAPPVKCCPDSAADLPPGACNRGVRKG